MVIFILFLDNIKRMSYTIYELKFMHNDKLYNYIGCTINLKKRTIQHKTCCYNPRSDRYNFPLYMKIRQCDVKWTDLEINIIEDNIEFERKSIREQYHMDTMNPNLNQLRAIGLVKNRVRGVIFSESPIVCECGVPIKRRDQLLNHVRSQKHEKRMQILNF